jgi:hypothetical protein
MLPPLPRRSDWAYSSLNSPSHISLPRKGRRVGLRIVLFEACSAFTRVAVCTLARSPIRDPPSEGFSHFVASMTAPVASRWSGCRVGLAPTGKRRLVTAHTHKGHWGLPNGQTRGPNNSSRMQIEDQVQEECFGRRVSRISNTGQSGTFLPEHWLTVLASKRSSFLKSSSLARMSCR